MNKYRAHYIGIGSEGYQTIEARSYEEAEVVAEAEVAKAIGEPYPLITWIERLEYDPETGKYVPATFLEDIYRNGNFYKR